MTNKQLAEQFATEFHANKNWSPLDRNEWRAISMFAEWLDKRSVEPTASRSTQRRLAAMKGEPQPTFEPSEKPCTCHPDDNPPRPCPRKYALSECRKAASELTEHPALPAGDVLAHQLTFKYHGEILETWWQARGGHDKCTVCAPENRSGDE